MKLIAIGNVSTLNFGMAPSLFTHSIRLYDPVAWMIANFSMVLAVGKSH